jgi:general secretion pathway protein K
VQKDVGIRAFTDVHQLALIPGMTSEFLDAIAPLTTVFGYGKINGVTAPRGVIAALPDLNKEQITALLDAREGTLNEDWLAKHLGSTKDFVTINSRAVAAVELTVKLIDGYHSRVKVVFMIVPGDAEPYRVLAWNPVSFGTSKSHTADGS